MGFLEPHNLLWGISFAILIAIYLRSRSRHTLEVSSLMLFDRAPAPASRIRHVRIDPLFWLEVATLGALTLACAGFFVRTAASPAHGRARAIVFALGAAMRADDGSGVRLETAKRQALKLIDDSSDRDEFTIICYGLDAELISPPTTDRAVLRKAISGMHAMEVPARRAALAAALLRAHSSAEIHLFADRMPADAADDPALSSRLHFHRVGAPADNLAIVALDPGFPTTSRGRLTVRNFSRHPHGCELVVDNAGKELLHRSLILAPREQIALPFGPLENGGLVHARIVTPDALDADNERYAVAPENRSAHAIVLSSDSKVRDDLSRVLLAVNPNFIVRAQDPGGFKPSDIAGERYALAVMHDCYAPDLRADATLFVYPPRNASGSPTSGVTISTTSGASRFSSVANSAAGATRSYAIAGWMTPIAASSGPETSASGLAAVGDSAMGPVGLIGFDVRDHLLLDPDRLDALVATVDVVRALTAAPDLRIVSTGTYVSMPAAKGAEIQKPNGAMEHVTSDEFGRIRFRPLETGVYRVRAGGRTRLVYANYYDASESDLSESASAAQGVSRATHATSPQGNVRQIEPLGWLLAALALLALAVESAMLIRRAPRWGSDHV